MTQVMQFSSNTRTNSLTTKEMKAKLIEKYKVSSISKCTRTRIQDLKLIVCPQYIFFFTILH